MNKTTFILSVFLLIVTSSSADYLYPSEKNICVSVLSPFQGSTGVCYTVTSTGVITCDKLANYDDFIDGYEYLTPDCVLKNDLSLTGLTQNQWNYFLAFLAHLIGFTMLFLTNFTILFVMKR